MNEYCLTILFVVGVFTNNGEKCLEEYQPTKTSIVMLNLFQQLIRFGQSGIPGCRNKFGMTTGCGKSCIHKCCFLLLSATSKAWSTTTFQSLFFTQKTFNTSPAMLGRVLKIAWPVLFDSTTTAAPASGYNTK